MTRLTRKSAKRPMTIPFCGRTGRGTSLEFEKLNVDLAAGVRGLTVEVLTTTSEAT
jgi:hypothetical protein